MSAAKTEEPLSPAPLRVPSAASLYPVILPWPYFQIQVTLPESKVPAFEKSLRESSYSRFVRLHANNCVIVQFRAKAAEMPAVLRMLDRAKIGTEFGNVDVIPIAFTLPGFLHDQRNFEEAQQRDTATAALSAIFKKDGSALTDVFEGNEGSETAVRTAIGLWNKRVHPDLTTQKPFSPEKEEDESKSKKDRGERKGHRRKRSRSSNETGDKERVDKERSRERSRDRRKVAEKAHVTGEPANVEGGSQEVAMPQERGSESSLSNDAAEGSHGALRGTVSLDAGPSAFQTAPLEGADKKEPLRGTVSLDAGAGEARNNAKPLRGTLSLDDTAPGGGDMPTPPRSETPIRGTLVIGSGTEAPKPLVGTITLGSKDAVQRSSSPVVAAPVPVVGTISLPSLTDVTKSTRSAQPISGTISLGGTAEASKDSPTVRSVKSHASSKPILGTITLGAAENTTVAGNAGGDTTTPVLGTISLGEAAATQPIDQRSKKDGEAPLIGTINLGPPQSGAKDSAASTAAADKGPLRGTITLTDPPAPAMESSNGSRGSEDRSGQGMDERQDSLVGKTITLGPSPLRSAESTSVPAVTSLKGAAKPVQSDSDLMRAARAGGDSEPRKPSPRRASESEVRIGSEPSVRRGTRSKIPDFRATNPAASEARKRTQKAASTGTVKSFVPEIRAQRFVVMDGDKTKRGIFGLLEDGSMGMEIRSKDGESCVRCSVLDDDEDNRPTVEMVLSQRGAERVRQRVDEEGVMSMVCTGLDGESYVKVWVDEKNTPEILLGKEDSVPSRFVSINGSAGFHGMNTSNAMVSLSGNKGYAGLSVCDTDIRTRATLGWYHLKRMLDLPSEHSPDCTMLQLSGREAAKDLSDFPETTLSVTKDIAQLVAKKGHDGDYHVFPPMKDESDVAAVINVENKGVQLGVVPADGKIKVIPPERTIPMLTKYDLVL